MHIIQYTEFVNTHQQKKYFSLERMKMLYELKPLCRGRKTTKQRWLLQKMSICTYTHFLMKPDIVDISVLVSINFRKQLHAQLTKNIFYFVIYQILVIVCVKKIIAKPSQKFYCGIIYYSNYQFLLVFIPKNFSGPKINIKLKYFSYK